MDDNLKGTLFCKELPKEAAGFANDKTAFVIGESVFFPDSTFFILEKLAFVMLTSYEISGENYDKFVEVLKDLDFEEVSKEQFYLDLPKVEKTNDIE